MSTTATQPTFTPEFASTYKDMMLGRIEHEQKTTRKVIDAIPNQKLDYKHDPKGRTALELAHHIVASELWFLNGIAEGKFEWKDPEPLNSKAELLALYDREFPKAMARAKATTGDHLVKITDFFGMKMPTFSFIQFCQDHAVHHRGQLSTFLRPMGGKVPDIYGGSADEPSKARPRPVWRRASVLASLHSDCSEKFVVGTTGVSPVSLVANTAISGITGRHPHSCG